MFSDALTRSEHPELLAAATASFSVFDAYLGNYWEEAGLDLARRDLATMTVWSLEHGMALLLLSRQIPLAMKPVDAGELRNSALEILLRGVPKLAGG